MADILMSGDGDLARYVNQINQCDMSVTRNVMRNVTVGALVSVWGVVRHKGKRVDDDLVLAGLSVSVIDDIADLAGFGEAMSRVGWVVEDDNGLVFPSFFGEFNVDPAEEQRKKNAERQRKYRETHGQNSNVTRNVTVTPKSNIEKRREEKSIKRKVIKEKSVRDNPPTVEEVRAHMLSQGKSDCAEEFHAYYAANGWVQGKSAKPLVDWKAAVTNWFIQSKKYNKEPSAPATKPGYVDPMYRPMPGLNYGQVNHG
jgi:alkylated DNA nucleotide flippase Atl1